MSTAGGEERWLAGSHVQAYSSQECLFLQVDKTRWQQFADQGRLLVMFGNARAGGEDVQRATGDVSGQANTCASVCLQMRCVVCVCVCVCVCVEGGWW